MDKQGKAIFWLAALFSIIVGLFVIYDHRVDIVNFFDGFSVDSRSALPDSTHTKSSLKPFEIKEVALNYLKPLRDNMYANSINIMCYSFTNPNGKINSSFDLIGEWFFDGSKSPDAQYNDLLPYDETFGVIRYTWDFVGNYSSVRYRLGLALNNTPLINETNYDLITDVNVTPYLEKEADGSVTWDDDVLRELIKENVLCGKSDEEQTKMILQFVREKMNPPLRTEEESGYNSGNLGFAEAWSSKVGTSSEYSVVFASFLRAVGIPAKIEVNQFEDYGYYYVKVYIQDKGWLPVDVYNPEKGAGEYFILKGGLKKDVLYKDVVIPGLSDYVYFDSIIANSPWEPSDDVDYTIRNIYDKPLKSFCITASFTYLDGNHTTIFSKDTYLLGSSGLDKDTVLSSSVYTFNHLDFDTLEIKGAFSDLCI